jgi:hypothetical protein
MPDALVDVKKLLLYRETEERVRDAAEKLKDICGPGKAYDLCQRWQERFEWALLGPVPAWAGLAAFRCIIDFTIPLGELTKILRLIGLPLTGKIKSDDQILEKKFGSRKDFPKLIEDPENIWLAYYQYFVKKRVLYSGKPTLTGRAQKHFLDKLRDEHLGKLFETSLGGQAGNILWLWSCIGADVLAYTPYLYRRLTGLKELASLEMVRLANGQFKSGRLGELASEAGVRKINRTRIPAPSGGSFVVVRDANRLIYQLQGIFDIEQTTPVMDWNRVRFVSGDGVELTPKPVKQRSRDGINWPPLPFFCECHIDDEKTLVVKLASDGEIRRGFGGRVNFTIVGGIDAIYQNKWMQGRAPQLKARLSAEAERQLRALAGSGVRIGMELSGVPGPEYFHFLERLCRGGVIVALGINGVEELGDVVGHKGSLKQGLYNLWLDPNSLGRDPRGQQTDLSEARELRKLAADAKGGGSCFEYVTYKCALKLAEAIGVPTLYVHTTTLDIILKRNADPGSLLHAQLGDMMAKGLVLGALLRRSYGEQWSDQIDKLPAAINPEAMKRLGAFARQFEDFEGAVGAADQLLEHGYWLGQGGGYSLAVVPVMWPPASGMPTPETQQDPTSGGPKQWELPDKLNPTGSGDMTFGAFFLLGGV